MNVNKIWTIREKERVREQMRQLAGSELFINAPRQIRFLDYVVQTVLDGEGAELNQARIAIAALDRGPDYDPSIDSSVRVEAGRLRSKLREYYAGVGQNDPIRIFLPKGRYSPEITFIDQADPTETKPFPQEIRFLKTDDHTTLAYAESGKGYPLVKAANWLSHLEYDHVSPIWKHWWAELSSRFHLIRYDERGCGLSDWDVDQFSVEAWVNDLEHVADKVGVKKFALLGISQGASVAIDYAVRHPDRVSHLILYGGFAQGRLMRDVSPEEKETARILQNLIRLGWGQNNPAFSKTFASLFIPDGTAEQMDAFDALQRASTSPKNAERFLEAFNVIDVTELVAQVQVPTLVLHARHEHEIPFDQARLMASTIPNAQLVSLDSRNHVLGAEEPAWQHFLQEIDAFISADPLSS